MFYYEKNQKNRFAPTSIYGTNKMVNFDRFTLNRFHIRCYSFTSNLQIRMFLIITGSSVV